MRRSSAVVSNDRGYSVGARTVHNNAGTLSLWSHGEVHVEYDVVPWEHPQTRAGRNQNHRVVRFGELYHQQADLFRRQYKR